MINGVTINQRQWSALNAHHVVCTIFIRIVHYKVDKYNGNNSNNNNNETSSSEKATTEPIRFLYFSSRSGHAYALETKDSLSEKPLHSVQTHHKRLNEWFTLKKIVRVNMGNKSVNICTARTFITQTMQPRPNVAVVGSTEHAQSAQHIFTLPIYALRTAKEVLNTRTCAWISAWLYAGFVSSCAVCMFRVHHSLVILFPIHLCIFEGLPASCWPSARMRQYFSANREYSITKMSYNQKISQMFL